MNAVIYPSRLSGKIDAIASKSQAHRLLICAALADRETVIRCATLSADIEATAECLRGLGADIQYRNGMFHVRPIRTVPEHAVIDCGESGSTLRFLLPVVCALGTDAEIILHGRLPERPLSPLWEELQRHGATLSRPSADRIHASAAALSGGTYTLAADVSSQFISGLLFALPLLGTESRIELTGTPESFSYLEMTARALRAFGVQAEYADQTYTIPADRRFHSPVNADVEGDWSNGAFWICANLLLGGTLDIAGLDPNSPQGDRAVSALSQRIARGGADVDCRDVPDLVPVLSVLASVSPGQTVFRNAGRLRIKESDRLTATAGLLTALGGRVQELDDGLIVTGVPALTGGEVDSVNDHRIAMSAAIAALRCTSPVILHGAQAVNKSYPAFWDDYKRLGGNVILEDNA